MRMPLAALIAIVAAPSLALAQDRRPPPPPPPPAFAVVPRVTFFNGSLSGNVSADEASFPAPILDGTSIRFDSDLDLDDSDPVWLVEITGSTLAGGRSYEHVSVSWLEARFEGSSTFGSTETFNGRTFPAGTEVESEFRYRSFGADFTVVGGDAMGFENAQGTFYLGARYADIHVELEGGGAETDERLRLLYLGGGFRGEGQWGPWLSGILQGGVYFSTGGIWDYDGREEWGGVIFEGQAGVGASFGVLHVEAGWRIVTNSSYAEVDESDKFEDNEYSIQLDGPYFSATLRF